MRTILVGDCLEQLRTLPDCSVHMCVTSPPYWGLRDYGVAGQLGLEPTPEEYVAKMVAVFREVRRVLRDDGTLWLNLGDSYAASTSNNGGYSDKSTLHGFSNAATKGRLANESGTTVIRKHGLKPKDLVGIPWRVAFALQADGWYLRQDIIWAKPNPMPESVTDRCTKSHEYIFLLSKSARYYYDAEAISEPSSAPIGVTYKTKSYKDGGYFRNGCGASTLGGACSKTRNRRSVWHIATSPYKKAHFAVFPPKLVEPCILAGCPEQCCAKCGAGYKRITDRQRTPTRPGSDSKVTGDSLVEGNRDPYRHVTTSTTIGWEPSCCCSVSETVPGVVLDPFTGSGTTAAVAAQHGRSFIGCELNPDYVALIDNRVADHLEKVERDRPQRPDAERQPVNEKSRELLPVPSCEPSPTQAETFIETPRLDQR